MISMWSYLQRDYTGFVHKVAVFKIGKRGKLWGWGSELYNIISSVFCWLEQVTRPDQDPGGCKWLFSSKGLNPPHQNLNQSLFDTGSLLYIMPLPNLSSLDLITLCLKWRQFDSISICQRPGVQPSRCTDGLLPPALQSSTYDFICFGCMYNFIEKEIETGEEREKETKRQRDRNRGREREFGRDWERMNERQ